jgi:drug/metabolite transporter (DMT)-like permease
VKILLLASLLGNATPFATLNHALTLRSATTQPATAATQSSLPKAPSSQGISRRHNAVLQMANTQSRATGRTHSTGDLTGLSASAIDTDEQVGFANESFDDQVLALEIELAPQQAWASSLLDAPSLLTGRLLVLFAAAVYGTNFPAVKMLDQAMPLSISATLRFGLAAAVVAAVVLGRESGDADAMTVQERKLAFWSGAEIGFWYCIGYISQAEGLHTVSAGKVSAYFIYVINCRFQVSNTHFICSLRQSAFFNALAVIVVPILDCFLRGKILDGKAAGAVALACAGVGLLELGPTGDIHVTSGDLMALSQTLFFGVGYWRLESASHGHPHQAARLTVGQLSAVAMGAAIYTTSEFALGHVTATTDQFVEWLGDPFIVGSLVWTGLVSTALALYMETVASKVVSATELTLLMTTVSLWGAAFAYIGIGEVLTPTGMVGGALIMGGCVLGNISPGKSKHPVPLYKETDEAARV